MRGRPRPQLRVVALAAAGGVAALVLLAATWSGIEDIALAVAALAALIVPGIALAISLRPAGSLRRLDLFLAAAALSLGCVAIGGLVLNLVPGGLSRTSWLGLVVVLLLAIAVVARRGLPPLRRETWVTPKAGQSLAMVGAVVLVAVAVLIARAGVKQPSVPFSALWIVPAAAGMAQIGLDNEETVTITFRVDVSINGAIQTTIPAVTVAAGERWTTLVAQPDPGGPPLDVRVYLAGQPDVVYRRVTFSSSAGTGP